MRITSLALCCALVGLTGCAPRAVLLKPRYEVFDVEQFRGYDAHGTGTLSAEAFLRTRGGAVISAAGQPFIVVPATDYTREWFDRQILHGERLVGYDQRMERFARRGIVGIDGRFSVSGLPDGRYYVATQVAWEARPGSIEGSALGQLAFVKDGKGEHLILTK